jgi:hypothetical protein
VSLDQPEQIRFSSSRIAEPLFFFRAELSTLSLASKFSCKEEKEKGGGKPEKKRNGR